MKRWGSPAVLAAILMWVLWMNAAPLLRTEQKWRELRTRATLRVGIDPGIAPFSYYDASGWNGLDADLSRELAARLKLQLQSDPVGYDALYDALLTERVDVIISAVGVDGSKTGDTIYSSAYFDAGPRLLCRCVANVPDQLAHKRIAVALGGDADQALRFWSRRVVGLVAIHTNTNAEARAVWQSGQADGALVDGLFALTPSDDSLLQSIGLMPKPFVIAAHKNNAHLLREINGVLATLQQEGVLNQLRAKWLR